MTQTCRPLRFCAAFHHNQKKGQTSVRLPKNGWNVVNYGAYEELHTFPDTKITRQGWRKDDVPQKNITRII